MQSETQIIDKFSNLILGINLASSLDQDEKDFLIDLLNDELQTELHCAQLRTAMEAA